MAPSQLVCALLLVTVSAVVRAIPLLPSRAEGGASALSLDEISAFKPYTHYASAAYCKPNTTLPWTCGPHCDANPSFVPIASGGEGTLVESWYVGYDPTLDEIIVAHQGTGIDKIIPDLTEAEIDLAPLRQYLFPGVESPVSVHRGFADAHARRGLDLVLLAVRSALSIYDTSSITVTGHSLGAAIALLDLIFLPLHLPNTTVRYIGYGLPRVGNIAFANYVDAQPASVTRISNNADPIPVLPPIPLGFHHPRGEVHIRESGEWVSCPGQENLSADCAAGGISAFMFNESSHDGPYDGVSMGC
ncbi:alpha/beta-hydrolase [Trametes elegans]|nr:alpha/beta-hydrolase [Trametes elegans]